jgi:hypothetical protein
MSTLSCTFCTHPNPEGSKFCNECGSPLHLAPCPHCQAVNDVSAAQCFQCGAALARPDDPPSSSVPPLSLGSTSPASTAAVSPHGDNVTTDAAGNPLASVPAAFADHFEGFQRTGPPHDLVEPIRAHAQDRLLIEPDEHRTTSRPASAARPDFGGRTRAYGIVGGISIACLGGALAWAWWNPFPRSEATALTPTLSSNAAPPAMASAPAGTSEPAGAALPAPPPAASMAASTPAKAPAQVAPSDSTVASSSTAPAAAPAPPAPDVLGELGPISDAAPPVALDPLPALDALPDVAPLPVPSARPRIAATPRAPTRTREQAERDAIATQRLIARDLAEFQREARRDPASRQ